MPLVQPGAAAWHSNTTCLAGTTLSVNLYPPQQSGTTRTDGHTHRNMDATQRASHTTPPAPDCSYRLGDHPGGRSRPSSYARARSSPPAMRYTGWIMRESPSFLFSLARYIPDGARIILRAHPGPLPSRVIKSAGVETRDHHTPRNSRERWAGRLRTYQWASRSSGCSFQASVAATFACGGVLDK